MIKKAKELAIHEKDTGASEVQIELLTEKIEEWSKHGQDIKKEKKTTVGLVRADKKKKK